MYWLKRLHEIQDAAKDAGEKRLKQCAVEAISRMLMDVKERNSDILRVFKDAGDLIYEDKHLVSLKRIVEGEGPFFPENEDGEESEKTEGKEKLEESKMPEGNKKDNWVSLSPALFLGFHSPRTQFARLYPYYLWNPAPSPLGVSY